MATFAKSKNSLFDTLIKGTTFSHTDNEIRKKLREDSPSLYKQLLMSFPAFKAAVGKASEGSDEPVETSRKKKRKSEEAETGAKRKRRSGGGQKEQRGDDAYESVHKEEELSTQCTLVAGSDVSFHFLKSDLKATVGTNEYECVTIRYSRIPEISHWSKGSGGDRKRKDLIQLIPNLKIGRSVSASLVNSPAAALPSILSDNLDFDLLYLDMSRRQIKPKEVRISSLLFLLLSFEKCYVHSISNILQIVDLLRTYGKRNKRRLWNGLFSCQFGDIEPFLQIRGPGFEEVVDIYPIFLKKSENPTFVPVQQEHRRLDVTPCIAIHFDFRSLDSKGHKPKVVADNHFPGVNSSVYRAKGGMRLSYDCTSTCIDSYDINPKANFIYGQDQMSAGMASQIVREISVGIFIIFFHVDEKCCYCNCSYFDSLVLPPRRFFSQTLASVVSYLQPLLSDTISLRAKRTGINTSPFCRR